MYKQIGPTIITAGGCLCMWARSSTSATSRDEVRGFMILFLFHSNACLMADDLYKTVVQLC